MRHFNPFFSPLKFLKQFFPKSLHKRFVLITLVPIIMVQILSLFFFINRTWNENSKKFSELITSEIIFVKDLYENNYEMFNALDSKFCRFNFFVSKEFPSINAKKKIDMNVTLLKKFFLTNFNSKNDVRFFSDKNNIILSLATSRDVLNFVVNLKDITCVSNKIFILWNLCFSLILLLIACLFLRNQVSPILKLSNAMKIFSIEKTFRPLKPFGAKEIKTAIESFNIMAEEMQKYINEKNYMLAGVSHDLKTYLTRMRLQLALIDCSKEDFDNMNHDISDMLSIINEFIEYSKSENYSEEFSSKINLYEMINSIVLKYKNSKLTVSNLIDKKLKIYGQEHGLKRCFLNIIDNSFKYADFLEIESQKDKINKIIRVIFKDNGPGIDESHLQKVVDPFYKVDNSRDVSKSGFGLGLSITKKIIEHHKGKMILESSVENKGLKVVIEIPMNE